MSLLIVGATGTLGRQITRHALDRGLKVKCFVRYPKKANFLREWGADLVAGNLNNVQSLDDALEGVTEIIDAATTRATGSMRIKDVDWLGKVSLIQAAERAKVERFVFFSILNAEKYPNVPLMEIKRCTEKFLAESGLKYTILRPCGFMQGLIGQYAIPMLDNQTVWITGESTAIAYMDTQDIAKFAVRALEVPETVGQSYPVVGSKAWKAEEIIEVCERLSGKEGKIWRLPMGLLRFMRGISHCFQWTYNISDRLAFAEVLASGQALDAPMAEVYQVFGLDPSQTTTLESYLQEYFSRILKKLKEIDFEKQKAQKKKKTPFKKKA